MPTTTITVGQGRAVDLFGELAELIGDQHQLHAQHDTTITVASDEDIFGPLAAMAHDWGFRTTTDVTVEADGHDAQALTFDRTPT